MSTFDGKLLLHLESVVSTGLSLLARRQLTSSKLSACSAVSSAPGGPIDILSCGCTIEELNSENERTSA